MSRVQFDSVTEQLSSMFNELMSKVTDQEQDWNKLMDKLSAEMDCKVTNSFSLSRVLSIRSHKASPKSSGLGS